MHHLPSLVTVTKTFLNMDAIEELQHKNSIMKISMIQQNEFFLDSTKSAQIMICPHAKDMFGNLSAIEEAIVRAQNFHVHGGNLKALQEFLDAQIHFTYEHYNLNFQPNSEPVWSTINQENKTQSSPTATLLSNDIVLFLKEHYETEKQLYSVRGGYGQELPGQFKGDNSKAMIGGRWVDVVEPHSPDRWKISMGPVGPNCTNLTSFGMGYEQKYLCDSPRTTAMHNQEDECHILSIGSNDQWGFERDVLNLRSNCHTHTFDCTLPGPPKKQPKHTNMHFYPYCISSKTETKNGRQYLTYEELWSKTGVPTAPTAMKIDVEGFEYDVWAHGILTASSTIWPEQVIMEMHYSTRMVDLPWMLRQRQTGELALFFSLLFQKGGYIPAYQFWQVHAPLLEVLMVRVICR